MRGFLIDPKKRTITEVHFKDCKELATLTGCDREAELDCWYVLQDTHMLSFSGGGFFGFGGGLPAFGASYENSPEDGSYRFVGVQETLRGLAIVSGKDDSGYPLDAEATLEEVTAAVRWM
jgi:hypothetical protein